MNIAKYLKKRLFWAMFPVAFSTLLFAANEEVEHQILISGDKRTALIHFPLMHDTDKLPALIVLHGGLGNAEHVQDTTGIDALGETEGFLTVYPNGTGLRFFKNRRTWNAGRCCGPAAKKTVDDVGFLSQLIDDLVSDYQADPKKIYITGFSNGAMMAYRLACEIPEKIAAIVPVSGTLAVDNCQSATAVPVLHIHGEADDNVPVLGGEGSRSVAGVKHRSVQDSLNIMMRERNCGTAQKEPFANYERVTYVCTKGANVQFIMIKNSGHVWPEKIQANRTVWSFVSQFVKK
ncbi:alpha/beta hydrolase family esterase [Neptuniibacter marinus]|uniref:alpha/beta hydrolase family esterase n=1 Tax=Neptuniibacter marinus TaxID=1806670 RepID=UPI0008303452|nr:PHB depolymerase family esterase [Neptuniibacter marinus]